MRIMPGLILVSSALLVSCGSAGAVSGAFNADDDQHCVGLTDYFAVEAFKEIRAGEKADVARIGAFIMRDWYRKQSGMRADDSGPFRKAMAGLQSDWESGKTAMKACVQRAAHDPGFEPFAEAWIERWQD